MIKRYALSGRTTSYGTPIISELEHVDGVYCKFEDVEPIIAERDALATFADARTKQINELMDELARFDGVPPKDRLIYAANSIMVLTVEDCKMCDWLRRIAGGGEQC